MLPITKTIPKELLPVGNKPVIQYIVEGVVGAGIHDIVILSSQSKKALEDYFDKNYELEELLQKKGKSDLLEAINKPKNLARYSFIKQTEQAGTGHAILQAAPWINDDFFMVIYGDTIFHPDAFAEMIALHQQTGKSVMLVVEVPQQDVSKYGVIKMDEA
jgi:UTP--glucose-1-phosphate uridylyltransferase